MDPEQVDLMLAFLAVEHDYGSHGHPIDEATSPDADPNNYEGGYRYVPHHQVDFAQRAINEDIRALKLALGEHADISDVRFWVEREDYSTPDA